MPLKSPRTVKRNEEKSFWKNKTVLIIDDECDQYSINVKDNSGQIYKAFERDSFSVDLLKKIKKSFNEEKLKKATIFKLLLAV